MFLISCITTYRYLAEKQLYDVILSELAEEREKLQEENDYMTLKVSNANGNAHKLQMEKYAMEKDLRSATSKETNLAARLTELEKENKILSDLAQERKNLQEENDAITKKVSNANEHVHKLEIENDGIKKELSIATSKETNLAARLAELEKENNLLKENKETDKIHWEQVQKENEIIKEEAADKNALLRKLQREQSIINNSLTNAMDKEAHLAAHVAELEKEIDFLKKKESSQSSRTDEQLLNGVTLNDLSPESILARYPKVEIDTCLEYSRDDTGRFMDTNSWFEIARSINNVQRNKKALAFSLFRKKPDFPFGSLSEDERNAWEQRYAAPFERALGPDGFINYHYGDSFDFHLYLANDLAYLVDENKLPKHANLTIHIMKSSSIGAGPGAMWRFLSLSNQAYDIVASADSGKRFHDQR